MPSKGVFVIEEPILHEILDELPDSVLWVVPVVNEHEEVIDFKVQYSNSKANELTDHPKGKLAGLKILEDKIPSATECHKNFINFLKILESNSPQEFSFKVPHRNEAVETVRRKFKHGVLSITRDRAGQRVAEQKEQQKTKLLHTVIDHSPVGIMVYDAVRNEQNDITDFKLVLYNEIVLQLTGFSRDERRNISLKDLLWRLEVEPMFQQYVDTVETGKPFSFEFHFKQLQRWLSCMVVKLDDAFLLVLTDITERQLSSVTVEQQKNLLNDILKNSFNGISVTKILRNSEGAVIDGRTILANDAAVNFTGIPKDVYLSRSAVELEPDFLKTDYAALCIETLRTGKPNSTQFNIGPTNRWLELTISRLDEDHLITIFSDITSSKQAQLDIERSARQLQTIIDRTQTGIFTIVPVFDEDKKVIDFRFVLVNQALSMYLEKTPETLIGGTGDEWFPAYKKNGLFELFLDTYTTGNTNRFDLHYNADGIDAWINMMCTSFEEGVLVTFSDYTPVKKLQLEQEVLVDKLRQSNKNLEEFAYVASHDLQEPVRKVKTFSELLKRALESRLTENELQIFNKMYSASERMQMLINDLLEYAQASTPEPVYSVIDLGEKIGRVLEDMEVDIKEASADVQVGELPVIHGSDRQIHQLFQNLVSNAIKYRKQGEAPVVKISSSVISADELKAMLSQEVPPVDYHKIVVADNGIGFEQEYAEKIFQVFQRLHGKKEYKGTGVGLSIVKKVVQNHKGYVYAESTLGEGSAFYVFLPVDTTAHSNA
ncbi:PAS domain-containing sensor histidine kinase [Aridibaculum aurantiacum]|uniref:PAS domain-containing sensor histidine kinase n=1 Tax=Aridibaculum aurantiacum TaxID=2810307 RepID=UPI001A95A791|nr:PAS domain-containing sensor histidine kinase [Aridibaculum aurantiacum]